jgi:hypothetical protein
LIRLKNKVRPSSFSVPKRWDKRVEMAAWDCSAPQAAAVSSRAERYADTDPDRDQGRFHFHGLSLINHKAWILRSAPFTGRDGIGGLEAHYAHFSNGLCQGDGGGRPKFPGA